MIHSPHLVPEDPQPPPPALGTSQALAPPTCFLCPWTGLSRGPHVSGIRRDLSFHGRLTERQVLKVHPCWGRCRKSLRLSRSPSDGPFIHQRALRLLSLPRFLLVKSPSSPQDPPVQGVTFFILKLIKGDQDRERLRSSPKWPESEGRKGTSTDGPPGRQDPTSSCPALCHCPSLPVCPPPRVCKPQGRRGAPGLALRCSAQLSCRPVNETGSRSLAHTVRPDTFSRLLVLCTVWLLSSQTPFPVSLPVITRCDRKLEAAPPPPGAPRSVVTREPVPQPGCASWSGREARFFLRPGGSWGRHACPASSGNVPHA